MRGQAQVMISRMNSYASRIFLRIAGTDDSTEFSAGCISIKFEGYTIYNPLHFC
jgi:hypothetical protein